MRASSSQSEATANVAYLTGSRVERVRRIVYVSQNVLAPHLTRHPTSVPRRRVGRLLHSQSGWISTLKIPDVDTLRADLDGEATPRNTHHVHIGPFRRMVDCVRYGTALVPCVVSRCFAGHHINIGRVLRRVPRLNLVRVEHRFDFGVHQLVNAVFRSTLGQVQDGSLFARVDRNHWNTWREFIRNEPFVSSALQERARCDELPLRLGVLGRVPGCIKGDCQVRRWSTEAVDLDGSGAWGRRGNLDGIIWLATKPFRVTLFDLNAGDQILTNQ